MTIESKGKNQKIYRLVYCCHHHMIAPVRRNGEEYEDLSRSRRDGRCYADNDDLTYVFVEISFDALTSG